MFKPVRYEQGSVVEMQTGTSTTITKYDALVVSSGYVQRAVHTDTEIRFIALEDVTTGGTGAHSAILCLRTDGIQFEADCTHDSAQSQVGTKVDLTDHDHLDNDSASTDYTFLIEALSGATTNKKVLGSFVMKTA